jgi:hypothetical protein
VQYDLKVLRDDEIVVAERLVVTDLRELWSKVAKIAEHVDQPGSRIRVTEESGGIAILIGAGAARYMVKPQAPRPRTALAAVAPTRRARAMRTSRI